MKPQSIELSCTLSELAFSANSLPFIGSCMGLDNFLNPTPHPRSENRDLSNSCSAENVKCRIPAKESRKQKELPCTIWSHWTHTWYMTPTQIPHQQPVLQIQLTDTNPSPVLEMLTASVFAPMFWHFLQSIPTVTNGLSFENRKETEWTRSHASQYAPTVFLIQFYSCLALDKQCIIYKDRGTLAG